MTSTSIQVSLLKEEGDVLITEANRQMEAAIKAREKDIAEGKKVGNLKAIAASTVATQIIRAALPEVEKRQIDKKKESK